jgi:hypothetical protein
MEITSQSVCPEICGAIRKNHGRVAQDFPPLSGKNCKNDKNDAEVPSYFP